MILIAALMVGVGVGMTAFGLHASRVLSTPTEARAVLIQQEPERPGLVYRVFQPLVRGSVGLVRAVSPTSRLELTSKRIVYAGLEGRLTVEGVLTQKALAGVLGAVVGAVTHPLGLPAALTALVVGALATFVPDLLLDARARKRQDEIAAALPDALDLLSITVEAGLGLEQALSTVAGQLVGPLGDELRRLLREIELGVGRHAALNLLRERTNVRELSAFVVALLQADSLGMAVGEVLHIQADQVRQARRQKAREKAAKTPVKIMVPVIFGIFPALFVITLGPGAISIIHAFARM